MNFKGISMIFKGVPGTTDQGSSPRVPPPRVPPPRVPPPRVPPPRVPPPRVPPRRVPPPRVPASAQGSPIHRPGLHRAALGCTGGVPGAEIRHPISAPSFFEFVYFRNPNENALFRCSPKNFNTFQRISKEIQGFSKEFQ